VDFAVLGKRECCTGDTARRAANEYLYWQLADTNVATLNEVKPKLIVATCPHCMNTVGKEYKQIGGDFKVIHHTEYLGSLVASGKLVADTSPATSAEAPVNDRLPAEAASAPATAVVEARKKWTPKTAPTVSSVPTEGASPKNDSPLDSQPRRKQWTPKQVAAPTTPSSPPTASPTAGDLIADSASFLTSVLRL
jgi:hypothetical protein